MPLSFLLKVRPDRIDPKYTEEQKNHAED